MTLTTVFIVVTVLTSVFHYANLIEIDERIDRLEDAFLAYIDSRRDNDDENV